MREFLIRAGIALASFFVATGFEVSGIESPTLAVLFWILSGIIVLALIATWQPAQAFASTALHTAPRLRPRLPVAVRQPDPQRTDPVVSEEYPFIISDNVRWEDHGNAYGGSEFLLGNSPYCPKERCLTPLQTEKSSFGGGWASPPGGHRVTEQYPLHCLACEKDYLFKAVKTVQDARNEAIVKLLGKRNVEGRQR